MMLIIIITTIVIRATAMHVVYFLLFSGVSLVVELVVMRYLLHKVIVRQVALTVSVGSEKLLL